MAYMMRGSAPIATSYTVYLPGCSVGTDFDGDMYLMGLEQEACRQ